MRGWDPVGRLALGRGAEKSFRRGAAGCTCSSRAVREGAGILVSVGVGGPCSWQIVDADPRCDRWLAGPGLKWGERAIGLLLRAAASFGPAR